ncbi:bifunctional DNA primase/polymerase [Streptomyces sp. NPDC004044]
MMPLEYALRMAERDYAVFPTTRMKLPAIRSPHRNDPPGTPRCRGECGRLGHGVHDATTDPDRLADMFAAAPHAAGYGIACGRGDYPLLGIDLDRKNDVDGVKAFAALADQHGVTIPETTIIGTPSGGEHRWFTGPAGAPVQNSASKLGPGIDVRGYGGYLIGPGSITSKGAYTVVKGRPVAEFPDQLVPLTLPPPPRPRRPMSILPGPQRGSTLLGLVKFVLGAGEGELNNRLYWAACRAYETGTEADAISRALVDAAVSLGHPGRAAERTVSSARNAPTRNCP